MDKKKDRYEVANAIMSALQLKEDYAKVNEKTFKKVTPVQMKKMMTSDEFDLGQGFQGGWHLMQFDFLTDIKKFPEISKPAYNVLSLLWGNDYRDQDKTLIRMVVNNANYERTLPSGGTKNPYNHKSTEVEKAAVSLLKDVLEFLAGASKSKSLDEVLKAHKLAKK